MNLKNNFFENVPSDSFGFISHLSELNLSGHLKITSLSGSPFKKLSKLTNLSLNGCQIRSFNEHSVEGLEKLRFLDIGQNSISQFPNQAFRNLANLEVLEIGLNYISELNSQG